MLGIKRFLLMTTANSYFEQTVEDREAWSAATHGVTESPIRSSD